MGLPTLPMVYGIPRWSFDTVARLSVRPYPTIIHSPTECTNSSTSVLTYEPAVGKKWAFSRPSCFLTSENIALSNSLYCADSASGGFFPRLIYSMLCFLPTASAFLNSLRLTTPEVSTFSLTPIYTFSQKRGTADMQVGCVSFMDCCTSLGYVLTMIVAPRLRQ